ncbi:hypothetical protein DFA_06293 [Cavenderia fasciculata]|uniref:Uncharacterized protein n=1 Tax=Cavenderia fasciculata TaxID=261658 RepID=F4PKM3_CACFS|nr:uncharacterized protein DFA_06293 [Cavenderia fasciculata]EGG24147.1 hypothetical protein DFA_06293 [Cavenderia fasciculata]|eukprot:XP_004361998.1 hypothetical protein DFA_06293 [Cavenderia fasciculata]
MNKIIGKEGFIGFLAKNFFKRGLVKDIKGAKDPLQESIEDTFGTSKQLLDSCKKINNFTTDYKESIAGNVKVLNTLKDSINKQLDLEKEIEAEMSKARHEKFASLQRDIDHLSKDITNTSQFREIKKFDDRISKLFALQTLIIEQDNRNNRLLKFNEEDDEKENNNSSVNNNNNNNIVVDDIEVEDYQSQVSTLGKDIESSNILNQKAKNHYKETIHLLSYS